MVSSSLTNSSPSLAAAFDSIIVVEECRKYKPAPETYNHLAARVGKDVLDAEQMAEIWLVSGNPFDVVGGRAVGMNAIWVDRAGTGWLDAMILTEGTRPTEVVGGLGEVVDVVLAAVGK